MKTIILYHADWDGIVAAWVAKRALMHGAYRGRLLVEPVKESDIETYGVQYNQPFEVSVDGANVYVLDFSFPPDFMATIVEVANRVVMIDHHISAIKKWKGEDIDNDPKWAKLKVEFDTGNAGCALTYWYFYHNPEDPDELDKLWESPLVWYAEDHDLWRFSMHNSREWRAVMRSMNQSFESCDKLHHAMELGEGNRDYDDMLAKGSAIIEYQDHLVETAVRHAEQYEIDGYLCLGAQVPFDGLISLVAGKLAEEAQEVGAGTARSGMFGMCWFKAKGGRWVYSLRSRGSDDTFDVGQVAQRMGGGGHPAAAGFSSDKPPTEFLAENVRARREAEQESDG